VDNITSEKVVLKKREKLTDEQIEEIVTEHLQRVRYGDYLHTHDPVKTYIAIIYQLLYERLKYKLALLEIASLTVGNILPNPLTAVDIFEFVRRIAKEALYDGENSEQ